MPSPTAVDLDAAAKNHPLERAGADRGHQYVERIGVAEPGVARPDPFTRLVHPEMDDVRGGELAHESAHPFTVSRAEQLERSAA